MPRRRRPTLPAADLGRESPRAAEGAYDPWSADSVQGDPAFLTADDFDATGILAGVDACASSYWWVAELQSAAGAPIPGAETVGPAQTPAPPSRHQAARRSTPRSSTAAA